MMKKLIITLCFVTAMLLGTNAAVHAQDYYRYDFIFWNFLDEEVRIEYDFANTYHVITIAPGDTYEVTHLTHSSSNYYEMWAYASEKRVQYFYNWKLPVSSTGAEVEIDVVYQSFGRAIDFHLYFEYYY